LAFTSDSGVGSVLLPSYTAEDSAYITFFTFASLAASKTFTVPVTLMSAVSSGSFWQSLIQFFAAR